MSADWRLRWLAVPAGCLVLVGCGSSPQERANNLLDEFAVDPCLVISEQTRQALHLERSDNAEQGTCTWSYAAQPPHYLLTFEPNPTQERQQEYTRDLTPTKLTVKGQSVTRVTRPVASATSCVDIVNYDQDHGFIVQILEMDTSDGLAPSDACSSATNYTTSIIGMLQKSQSG